MKQIIFGLLFISLGCAAQVRPLFAPYMFTDSIFHHLALDTLKSKYQYAAFYLSDIGEYKKALMVWDSGVQKFPVLDRGDSAYFLKFKPVNAKEYIIERAKKERVIIINEAHHQPYHRVFTESLLQELYKSGFRYFGAEAVNRTDGRLNLRKYPVLVTGIYIRQPQYGNLIRTALQEGFYVFAYEADFSANPDMKSKEREIEQAKNIKAILDKDPGAKIVIHCGYDHLVEAALPGWEKAMAGRLKEYTGIDPFTIDQVKLTEASAPQYDNPYFKMVNLNYDAVFVDSAGNLFNGSVKQNQYDVRVYHPRTLIINGRPDWIFENNRHAYFINDKITITFPCLVFAYYTNEDYKVAIPSDVIELKNSKDKVALSLKKGKYRILINNSRSEEQVIELEAKD